MRPKIILEVSSKIQKGSALEIFTLDKGIKKREIMPLS
jgi:hypothetical protein